MATSYYTSRFSPNFGQFGKYCEGIGISDAKYVKFLWDNLNRVEWRRKFGKGKRCRDWRNLVGVWHKRFKGNVPASGVFGESGNKNTYEVWTDGSAVKRKDCYSKFTGGAAYVILHKGVVVKQGCYGTLDTTIGRMELLAIICGLGHCPAGSNVTVYSDSKYALKVLSGMNRAHKNTDLIELHRKHSKHLGSVCYQWVKGHSGNEMNEMCDKLANAGRIKAEQSRATFSYTS